jgi:hypothetical protein
MRPLLLLGVLGCKEEPKTPTETDGPDDTTPGIDLTGDTAFVPPEVDYFTPFNLYAVAYFGWDEQTATAGSYLWTTGTGLVQPQISFTVYTAEFLIDGTHATGACGVLLVYDTDNGALAPETWTFTRGTTEHTHLGFRIPAGTFSISDLPDPDRGMLGCSRHEFDPERFPYGLIAAMRERDWGFGLGTLDPDLAAEAASDIGGTATLLEDDLLVGGSFLTRGDPPYDGRWFTRGYALDADGRVQLEVPLTAEDMQPGPARVAGAATSGPGTSDTATSGTATPDTASSTDTGTPSTGTTGTGTTGTGTTGTGTTGTGTTGTVTTGTGTLPATGAYYVFPPDWVLFSSIW